MDAGTMPNKEITEALLNIVTNVNSEDLKVAIYLALKIIVETDAGKKKNPAFGRFSGNFTRAF
jgi:hypothetical protein